MGSKYTIQVWGKHYNDEYSYMIVWQGERFDEAIAGLMHLKEQKYWGDVAIGCVSLECR